MFFLNLVKRKVRLCTNKHDFLTLLHLRSFRQFQNLSNETLSRAAENLIQLCFVAFLSNTSKKCFIPVWIIYPSSGITAISILHCVVWPFWQQTLKSQRTEIWCEIQAEDFQTTSSSHWPNVGVGDIEKMWKFNLLASALDPKSRQIRAQRGVPLRHYLLCTKDFLWVVNKYISDRLSYTIYSCRNRAIYELRYNFGSIYFKVTSLHLTCVVKSSHLGFYPGKASVSCHSTVQKEGTWSFDLAVSKREKEMRIYTSKHYYTNLMSAKEAPFYIKLRQCG